MNTTTDRADHTDRAHQLQLEQLEALRDIRAELADLNEDMTRLHALTEDQVVATVQTRKIAAWTAIAVVPGAIASLYGSNFTHMPELEYAWAWPAFLVLLAGIAAGVFVTARRKGWL